MIFEALTEEEMYLFAILMDESGLDQAEFCYVDDTVPEEKGGDGCFRAWPFQWPWWRCDEKMQIDQGSRSCGKSLSIKMRAFAFPFLAEQEEMVISAPEGVHLDALTDNIETLYDQTRLAREMIQSSRGGIKHRPFKINFVNGSRIIGRIPQRDGKGMKGSVEKGSLVLTRDRGYVVIEDILSSDFVWSHLQRWTPVITTYTTYDEAYEVKGQGALPIKVTADHRFYIRNDVSKQPGKTKKQLGKFLWEWPENFTSSKYMPVNVYWTGCTDFGESIDIPLPDFSNTKYTYDINEDFWWVVGRMLADGAVGSNNIQISVHPKDQESLIQHMNNCGMKWSHSIISHSSADRFQLSNKGLANWFNSEFGHHSHSKEIPTWALTMSIEFRQALLDGYLSGDGCNHIHHGQERWTTSSASKKLTLGIATLASTLGYNIGLNKADIKVTQVMGQELKAPAQPAYRCTLTKSGYGAWDLDGFVSYKIKEAQQVPSQEFYGIVTEDHSYYAEGIIHHNTHPLWLEIDEASDYPEPAWGEINETLKEGNPNARWRAHGVTRGIGGTFDKHCEPSSDWRVHRLPAMYRPTWDDEERQKKVNLYGHKDNVDYRRNVLGLPGDQNSPIFVLYRLMENVDTDESSDLNTHDYAFIEIDEAMLRDREIEYYLDIPMSHKQERNFWIGMDVGWTLAPSAILVFAETKKPPLTADGKQRKKTIANSTYLKLITRILLRKVATQDQVKCIIHLMDFYRPLAFAMDSTGAGFPLLQVVQDRAREIPDLKHVVERIKGYNFSEKIIMEFDDNVEIDEYDPMGYEAAAIKKSVLEGSTDVLRELVDARRLILPNDINLIREFTGQDWAFAKSALDPYGRKKVFSAGAFHSLDAARMAVLAYQQNDIEIKIKNSENGEEPPPTFFI